MVLRVRTAKRRVGWRPAIAPASISASSRLREKVKDL